MKHLFRHVTATPTELSYPLPGDNLISSVDVVMDRAFTLRTTPEAVWPWLRQLGKHRAGWYFPAWVERIIPKSRRALRVIDPTLLKLQIGERIDDWGGKHDYLELAELELNRAIVYISTRGKITMSWSITIQPIDTGASRVHFRLRIKSTGKKRHWLFTIGDTFDALTILGLYAGLQQRLESSTTD